MDKNLITVHDRDVMKIGQLKTSFWGQGFKLVDIKLNDECEEGCFEGNNGIFTNG